MRSDKQARAASEHLDLCTKAILGGTGVSSRPAGVYSEKSEHQDTGLKVCTSEVYLAVLV